jgi:hypothetical protein
MTALAGEIPWAGVSHFFRFDLPFDSAEVRHVAEGRRGIRLLAICGGVETRLEALPDLRSMPPPGPKELANPGGQEKWRQISEQERVQLGPRIDELLERLRMPEEFPDHAVFLLCPTIPFPSGRIIENELPSRLRGKAQVISVMGENESGSIGDGLTYCNGKLLTNGIAVLCVSGFLPLQQDTTRLMALHLASLTNSPGYSAETLRMLQASPPARILSGEAIVPVRELAYAFDPHPLEALLHFFGLEQIKMLQEVDKLEVFEIKPPQRESQTPAGARTVEGSELVAQGKTLGSQAAQEFASTLLNEQNGIGAMSDCEWRPVIVFRAWRGNESAALLVCFQCNESVFRFYDAAGKLVRDTHPFFFAGRDVLLRLAREALPESPTLKSIAR